MKNIGRHVVLGLLYFIFFVFIVLLGAYFTGHNGRAYQILPFDDSVTIFGQKYQIPNLAAAYAPEIFIRPSTPSPPLLWIWFEAVSSEENSVDLIYYFVWSNEINPNPILHALYSPFRAAYYGCPLYDIEYFQVSIERSTGDVRKIRFETSLSGDFYGSIQKHMILVILRRPDGSYEEQRPTKDKNSWQTKVIIDPFFSGTRVRIGVQTWNHLSLLLNSHTPDFSKNLEAPLRPLSEYDFSRYKLVRRSQGDYHSREPWVDWPLVSCGLFITALILKRLALRFVRRKRLM